MEISNQRGILTLTFYMAEYHEQHRFVGDDQIKITRGSNIFRLLL